MDLCSVANISLLILDQPFHGFYVHGEAPSGRSDLVMSDLKEKLDAEGEGVQRRRGLKNYNDLGRQQPGILQGDVQSYEIYFPSTIREEYDALYLDRYNLAMQVDLEAKRRAKQLNDFAHHKKGKPDAAQKRMQEGKGPLDE